ncbi:D-isomer specific 2-hydroxyacid dehydrogenase [Xylariaceae sp. FL0594]|nr:D-isomer specific 2-hydroxyacid dehydrogenase [Xylariaceae sp. FL0594]
MAERTNTPKSTAPQLPTSGPQSLSSSATVPAPPNGQKHIVLYLGDGADFSKDIYAQFNDKFEIAHPELKDRQPEAFKRALKGKKWGDFSAIFRPAWGSGGEMGDWNAEIIDLLPNTVRVFASAGAGFDWADVKLLAQKNIAFYNSGSAAAGPVADFALALIIGTFRALPRCIASEATTPDDFQASHKGVTSLSHDLRNQVLGIVGFGKIGQEIAKRSLAFGMKNHYWNRTRKSADDEAKFQVKYCDTRESLIRGADCVVLCVPGSLGEIINAESLQWFKQGGRLVNVGRGNLVNEDALAAALHNEKLSCVALDVHKDKPNISAKLAKFSKTRAILTCHNAGGTVESHAGFEKVCVDNTLAALVGSPFEPVTPPANQKWLK